MFEYTAVAFVFPDDINTDYIISSRRKKDTIDPQELVPYLMEDIRPGFAAELAPRSLLVAGENFGCGSAMEVAAQIIRAAGIGVIAAKSFARSYFRNAINNGILPVEIDTSFIREGDCVQVRMDGDTLTVTDETTRQSAVCPAPGGKVREILNAGGLVPYMIQQKKKK